MKQPTPTSLVKRFLVDASIQHTGKALDIGFGSGGDTLALTRAGYSVVALDIDMQAVNSLQAHLPKNTAVEIQCMDIRDYTVEPNTYSVIVANNVLFFLGKKETILKTMRACIDGLKERGYFICSLLGSADEWIKTKHMPPFTFEEAVDYFQKNKLKVYFQSTEEGYGPMMSGNMKYWHLHRFILQRT